MNEMPKKNKELISEKQISQEYSLLQATHQFLNRQKNTKESELKFCLKKLETEYSDELQNRAQTCHEQLLNIIKKINWEIARCTEFDKKVERWRQQSQMQLISSLSQKILDRRK